MPPSGLFPNRRAATSSVARAETRRWEVSRASMLSHRPPSSELTGPASEGRSLCSCSVPPFQKSTITTRKWQFEQSSEHETREHSLAGSTYLDTIPPTKALEDPCIDVQVIDALQGLDLALEAVLGAGNWHRHAILFIADWTSPARIYRSASCSPHKSPSGFSLSMTGQGPTSGAARHRGLHSLASERQPAARIDELAPTFRCKSGCHSAMCCVTFPDSAKRAEGRGCVPSACASWRTLQLE